MKSIKFNIIFFLVSLLSPYHLWAWDNYFDFPNAAAPSKSEADEADDSQLRDYFSFSLYENQASKPGEDISSDNGLDASLNHLFNNPPIKAQAPPRIVQIVPLDFSGAGKAIAKDASEHEPSMEDVIVLCRQKFVLPDQINALKAKSLSPEEISALHKKLKNANPRTTNAEIEKTLKENVNKDSADAKIASEESKKRSLPAPPGPDAKKARILSGNSTKELTIVDFLTVAKEKSIEEQKIKIIFHGLKTHAIPGFLDLLKDLDSKRAQAHVDDAIKSMNSGKDDRFEISNKRTDTILERLGASLKGKGISFLNRNYLITLGRKILDRGVDENGLFPLIHVAISFTGMDKANSKESLTLTQAEDFCLQLAFQKAPSQLLMKLLEESKEPNNNYISDAKEGISINAVSYVSLLIAGFEPANAYSGSNFSTKGLANSFSDCFLNVSMQVLNGMPGLFEGLEASLKEKNSYGDDIIGARARLLHAELLEFFKGLRGQSHVYIPERNAAQLFRNFLVRNGIIPHHMSYGQKDAQEFFSALLDAILSGIAPENTQLLDKFELYSGSRVTLAQRFQQQLKQSAVQQNLIEDTMEISESLTTHVTEKILSLPIPMGNQRNALNVNDCLMSYFGTEDVELFEWELPSGTQNPKEIVIRDLVGQNGIGQKKLGLHQPHPEFLGIQLKRFDNNGRKIDTNISFDLEIDLGKYSLHDTGPVKYQLMGVIFHGGIDLFAGHYWAYVKDASTKNWHLFNDRYTKFLSVDEMRHIGETGSDRQVDVSGTAYMLFYELVN